MKIRYVPFMLYNSRGSGVGHIEVWLDVWKWSFRIARVPYAFVKER